MHVSSESPCIAPRIQLEAGHLSDAIQHKSPVGGVTCTNNNRDPNSEDFGSSTQTARREENSGITASRSILTMLSLATEAVGCCCITMKHFRHVLCNQAPPVLLKFLGSKAAFGWCLIAASESAIAICGEFASMLWPELSDVQFFSGFSRTDLSKKHEGRGKPEDQTRDRSWRTPELITKHAVDRVRLGSE